MPSAPTKWLPVPSGDPNNPSSYPGIIDQDAGTPPGLANLTTKWVRNPSSGLFMPENTDSLGNPTTATAQAALGSVVMMQNAAAATGAGTALPVSGQGVALLAISGTFVATITFQGVGPDGNTYTVQGRPRSGGAAASTATATGLYEVNCRGLTSVYANVTAWTSGAVTVKGVAQPLGSVADEMSLVGSNVPRASKLFLSILTQGIAVPAATTYKSSSFDNTGYSGACIASVTVTGTSPAYQMLLGGNDIPNADIPNVGTGNVTIGNASILASPSPTSTASRIRVVNTSATNSLTITNLICRGEG